MGRTTDFVGHIDITPALNQDEIDHLLAFSVKTGVDGQPRSRCGWVSSADGGCLTCDGDEKYGEPVEWLRHLVKHFRRQGVAHRIDGMVVGYRRDSKELFAIQASANRVTEKALRPGSTRARAGSGTDQRQRGPTAPRAANVIDLAARRAQG
jgi:hypothetical protein